jgi:hypothetical protein
MNIGYNAWMVDAFKDKDFAFHLLDILFSPGGLLTAYFNVFSGEDLTKKQSQLV